jgi:nifR3 family TIM-barrel protein
MTNFWHHLPSPFWVLAPMEDVTDTVFRQIVASVGRPHVFFTEFTNVEGILSSGSDEVMKRFKFSEAERPLVAQIWGNDPEKFYSSAKIIKNLGFDGIDINMGCPVKHIVNQSACSALIGQENLVKEIINATREGGDNLPISVKTRIGRKTITTEEWIGFLLNQELDALSIHGRTVAEMSKAPAHWDEIGKAVSLRNELGSDTLIIGNGDVDNLVQANNLVQEFGVDGVMIGRGIFANPAVFAGIELSQLDRNNLFINHISLFNQTWGKTKNFQILKKFVKTYVSGFEGATEIRIKLMQARDCKELIKMVEEI